MIEAALDTEMLNETFNVTDPAHNTYWNHITQEMDKHIHHGDNGQTFRIKPGYSPVPGATFKKRLIVPTDIVFFKSDAQPARVTTLDPDHVTEIEHSLDTLGWDVNKKATGIPVIRIPKGTFSREDSRRNYEFEATIGGMHTQEAMRQKAANEGKDSKWNYIPVDVYEYDSICAKRLHSLYDNVVLGLPKPSGESDILNTINTMITNNEIDPTNKKTVERFIEIAGKHLKPVRRRYLVKTIINKNTLSTDGTKFRSLGNDITNWKGNPNAVQTHLDKANLPYSVGTTMFPNVWGDIGYSAHGGGGRDKATSAGVKKWLNRGASFDQFVILAGYVAPDTLGRNKNLAGLQKERKRFDREFNESVDAYTRSIELYIKELARRCPDMISLSDPNDEMFTKLREVQRLRHGGHISQVVDKNAQKGGRPTEEIGVVDSDGNPYDLHKLLGRTSK